MLHTRTLNQAAQVSCPSHTLVRPSCSFYWLCVIERYEVGGSSNNVMYMPHFVNFSLVN
jgi:hypothetical protein